MTHNNGIIVFRSFTAQRCFINYFNVYFKTYLETKWHFLCLKTVVSLNKQGGDLKKSNTTAHVACQTPSFLLTVSSYILLYDKFLRFRFSLSSSVSKIASFQLTSELKLITNVTPVLVWHTVHGEIRGRDMKSYTYTNQIHWNSIQ